VSILLLSGGLDSAVCAAMTHPDQALFVNYGQPHAGQERSPRSSIATRFSMPLFNANVTLPFGIDRPPTPRCSFPGRNLILLSLAAHVIAGVGPLRVGRHRRQRRRPRWLSGLPREFFDAAEPALASRSSRR
jgi:7-cyano-7-deazaguanine synthase in queuosine biosynthesis